jgi:hypothetical protein
MEINFIFIANEETCFVWRCLEPSYTGIRHTAKLTTMLRWFHKKLKPIARGLLATIATLWLVTSAAPCVMAQSHPINHGSVHCPMHDGVKNIDADHCSPVTAISCHMPDINSPATVAFGNIAVTPALLTVMPVVVAVPDNSIPLQQDFFMPDIPAPPLHILNLTLIL